jgi:hypothetical protein
MQMPLPFVQMQRLERWRGVKGEAE